jgi:hypothetical protein
MEPTIQFVCTAARWFDKVNGNTYHSVRITRCADGATIAAPFQYGYGDQYRQTALEAMLAAGWLEGQAYNSLFRYERENGYPVLWNVTDGLKRDCVANGKVS